MMKQPNDHTDLTLSLGYTLLILMDLASIIFTPFLIKYKRPSHIEIHLKKGTFEQLGLKILCMNRGCLFTEL